MQKLENVQTKDRIAQMLRDEILSGRIEDGQELTQEQLAEMLQVSRMPVREALQSLESEGLLLRLPNRHMRVVGLSEHTIRENLRMVAAVETELMLQLMPKKADQVRLLDPGDDAGFHSSISKLTANPYLRRIHCKLIDGYPRYIWQNQPTAHSAELNRTILCAVEADSEPHLRDSIHRYYDSLADVLMTVIKEGRNHE